MWNIVLDTFIDALKALPILYLAYLLVEYFSHKSTKRKVNQNLMPLVASGLGIIPQCGFSSVMADLFSKKKISFGTILAVFIATSDEAIPVLVTDWNNIWVIFVLISTKFVYAVLIGYSVDFLFSRKKSKTSEIVYENHAVLGDGECQCKNCSSHGHEHDHKHESDCCSENIFLSALYQSLKIAGFILIVSLIINVLIYFIGIEKLSSVFLNGSILQVLFSSIIGLIPSCSVSVFLVELYSAQVITLSALIAGLCAGAGLGLMVLFAKNKNIKQNILITLVLFALSFLLGAVLLVCGL